MRPSHILLAALFLFLLAASVALRLYGLGGMWLDMPARRYDIERFVYYFVQLRDGGIAALGTYPGKISPLYLYVWLPLSNLQASPETILRISSFLMDYVAAFWAYRITRLRWKKPSTLPLCAAALVLFSPTLLTDASLWGQTDSYYIAFMLGGLFFLARSVSPRARKYDRAFAIFQLAIAFNFKLQTCFLLPLFAYLLARKQLNWKHAAWLAASYALVLLPRFLLGMSPLDALSAYPQQIDSTVLPNVSAAGIFGFFGIPGMFLNTVCWLGVFMGGLFTLGMAIYGSKDTAPLTPQRLLLLALLSLATAPYLLPRMHERYFLAADLLALIACFWFPRLWVSALFIAAAGFSTCMPYLFEIQLVPLPVSSAVMGLGIVYLWFVALKELRVHQGA